jgi:hypothetical protein
MAKACLNRRLAADADDDKDEAGENPQVIEPNVPVPTPINANTVGGVIFIVGKRQKLIDPLWCTPSIDWKWSTSLVVDDRVFFVFLLMLKDDDVELRRCF